MAWDRTKPVTNAALESAPVRANFQALDEAIGGINLYTDPNFLIWAAGDSAAPTGTSISGTGATVARSTGTHKAGGMAPELTMGSATSRLIKALMTTLDISLQGIPISWGAFVNTTTASLAKLEIDDGISQSLSTNFHTGGGGWEWMTSTRVLDLSATKLETNLVLDIGASSGIAYIDQATAVLGPIPPQQPKPGVVRKGSLIFPIAGDAVVATDKFRFQGADPFLILQMFLQAKTAPTGAALVLDANHWDGSTMQTMFTTKPQIADAASNRNGIQAPDGTYRWRCFDSQRAAGSLTDKQLSIDIDSIGSTLAGADVEVYVRTLQFDDLLADLAAL